MNVTSAFLYSTFVNLENLDRSTWITVGKLISFLSLGLNCFAIFLIITKSKKETPSYKLFLVASHFFLCLAQFFWASLMSIVPLLPFPAFIFYGFLANYVDVLVLTQTWIIAILSFLWALFGTLVIRFQMVVRSDSTLNSNKRGFRWILFATVSFAVVVTTIIFMFEILRVSDEETEKFIAWKYPKYSSLTHNYNLLVFSDKKTLHISAFSCFSIAALLISCYVTLSISIFVEVRHKVNQLSSALRNYHLKVLKDIIIQIIIKLITFTFFPIFTVSMYFVTPEFNAIVVTMIFYNIFISAPIPGTVVLLVQTPAYRQFILSLFVKTKIIKPLVVFNQRMTS